MKKTSTKKQDKRLNIVIRAEVWEGFTKFVPAGERTNFINDLIEKTIQLKARKDAIAYLDNVLKTNPLDMTTEEVIQLKNYGRK